MDFFKNFEDGDFENIQNKFLIKKILTKTLNDLYSKHIETTSDEDVNSIETQISNYLDAIHLHCRDNTFAMSFLIGVYYFNAILKAFKFHNHIFLQAFFTCVVLADKMYNDNNCSELLTQYMTITRKECADFEYRILAKCGYNMTVKYDDLKTFFIKNL
jgi:hypothetical protein